MKNAAGSGRTVVHETSCSYLGTNSSEYCDCPIQLSFRTLEGYRVRLATALDRLPGVQWGPTGNPANHWECLVALNEFKRAQLAQGVTTAVTKPAWAGDLRRVSEAMFLEAQDTDDVGARATLLHDRAYLLDTFRTALRGSQAGRTLIQQVLWLPNNEGLIFGYTLGKTLRDGSKHTFAVRREPSDPHLCLVGAIVDFMHAARRAGWDLSAGYLFRDLHVRGKSGWAAASVSPMTARRGTQILSGWLKKLGLVGFTIHGCRAGGALYRHFQGEDLEDLMYQAYWKSPQTAQHYLQLFKVAKVAGHELHTVDGTRVSFVERNAS